MRRSLFALVLSPVLLACLAGCHISSQKNGKNDNVDIGTPFGSMQVKTNDNVAVDNVGITPYPGAVEQKKEHGDDGAADVNLSFGSFHLGVKAVSYITPDAPEKVLPFYKKDLAKYGVVLQCDGSNTIGQPTRTAEGLTCSDEQKGVHFETGTGVAKKPDLELRTGSKQHMHIVGVQKRDEGTKISLIALDLPSNLDFDSDKKTN